VATEGGLTVALDIHITEELKREGVARDFVNRIQNLRKDQGLAVLDKINIEVERNGEVLTSAINSYRDYISNETQALTLELKDKVPDAAELDMDDFMIRVKISVKK
jgi:isoleucyl-tRNA synthetase